MRIPLFLLCAVLWASSLSSAVGPSSFVGNQSIKKLLDSLEPQLKASATVSGYAREQSGAPSTRELQTLLQQKCQHWNEHVSKYSRVRHQDNDPQTSPSNYLHFDVAELQSRLFQVVALSQELLLPRKGCPRGQVPAHVSASNRSAGGVPGLPPPGPISDPHPHGPCPALAPELLHPATAAFLAKITHQFPSGPSSALELEAWAAASLAFLEGHQAGMRAQRPALQQAEAEAEQAAERARAAAAALAAATAAAKEASAGAGVSKSSGPEGKQPGAVAAAASKVLGTQGSAGGLGGGSGVHRSVPLEQQGLDGAGGAAGGGDGNQGTHLQQQVQQQRRRRRRRLLQSDSGSIAAAAEPPTGSATSTPPELAAGQVAATQSGGGVMLTSDRAPFVAADTGADGEAADPAGQLNELAGPLGGLPVVRRVLLAQLLLGWLGPMKRELPAAAAEPVAAVVTKLYDIHVESVVQRAIVEYFHISKTAGTSWTWAAGCSGCRRFLANGGRVRQLDDDCRWLSYDAMTELGLRIKRKANAQVCSRYGLVRRASRLTTCTARLEDARQRGFQYLNNEYTLHGGGTNMYDTHICSQFVNVISIREPLERMVSNIRYILVRLAQTLFRKPDDRGLFRRTFCDAPAATWETYAPPVADNYNVRTLIGERAFHSPLYGIGEAHELLAKQLLLQYDLVLDLGSGDSAADLVMRSGLGWKCTLAEVHIWTLEKHANRSGLAPGTCRLGDLTPLLARQQHDQRWYRFGQTLSRLDQLLLSLARLLGLSPWPADWSAWGLPPPPPDGATSYAAAGIKGGQGGGEEDEEGAEDEDEEDEEEHRHCGLLGMRRYYSNRTSGSGIGGGSGSGGGSGLGGDGGRRPEGGEGGADGGQGEEDAYGEDWDGGEGRR